MQSMTIVCLMLLHHLATPPPALPVRMCREEDVDMLHRLSSSVLGTSMGREVLQSIVLKRLGL